MKHFVKLGEGLELKYKTVTKKCAECGNSVICLEVVADPLCDVCLAKQEAIEKTESEAKKKERINAKLTKAGYKKRHLLQTFDNLEVTETMTAPRIERLKHFIGSNKFLLLFGDRGTGKGHVAHAIGRKMLEDDPRAVIISMNMVTLAEWFRSRAYRAGGESYAVMHELATCTLLIISDLGVKLPSEHDKAIIENVLDIRHDNMLHTIVDGNIDPKKISDHLDIRIPDRIEQSAFYETREKKKNNMPIWDMTGPSQRANFKD